MDGIEAHLARPPRHGFALPPFSPGEALLRYITAELHAWQSSPTRAGVSTSPETANVSRRADGAGAEFLIGDLASQALTADQPARGPSLQAPARLGAADVSVARTSGCPARLGELRPPESSDRSPDDSGAGGTPVRGPDPGCSSRAGPTRQRLPAPRKVRGLIPRTGGSRRLTATGPL